MASCSGGGDGGGGLGSSVGTTREELKSQFSTREGVYRLLASLELSRSSRPPPIPYGTMSTQPPSGGPNPPLRLSFVTINSPNNDMSSVSNLNPAEEEEGDEVEGTQSIGSQPLHSPGVIGNDLLLPSDTDVMDRTTTRFCFNLGKELFVYPFQGSRKVRTQEEDKKKSYIIYGTQCSCYTLNCNVSNLYAMFSDFRSNEAARQESLQRDFPHLS